MNHFLFFTLLFPLVSSLAFEHTFHAGNRRLKPLCDLGCECPEEGQGLIFLNCGRKGINTLPTSLQLHSPITSLSFEGNHITFLNISTFSEASEIQELDFSLNEITDVQDYALSPFTSLAVLKMSHNRISGVLPGFLEKLDNLRVLELGHNNIHQLSHLAFESTPNLQEIKLQYNPIFSLPEDLFRYLPHLERLDLQETGLVDLPEDLFKSTPHLRWLSLSSNAFEVVPERALRSATLLDSLDLSGNDFPVLGQGSFHKMERLSLLYLNHLPSLRRVERDAFAGLAGLKTLSCSYNPKLSFIDRDAFGSSNSSYSDQRTPPKEKLYLRQNALRTLESPLESDHWAAMSFVDLGNNPWRCDCHLEWMTQLSREVQMNVECESPPQLRGQALASVKPDELQCASQWHFVTFVIVVSSMVTFGIVFLAASAVVCSRTPLGLKVRAQYQFAYAKVRPRTETVDLEWDPSADV